MTDFPLRNDSFQTIKSAAVTVYKGGKNVELVDVIANEKQVAVKLTVDGQEYVKSWEFFKEIKPDSKKIDNGSKTVSYTHLTLPTTERV